MYRYRRLNDGGVCKGGATDAKLKSGLCMYFVRKMFNHSANYGTGTSAVYCIDFTLIEHENSLTSQIIIINCIISRFAMLNCVDSSFGKIAYLLIFFKKAFVVLFAICFLPFHIFFLWFYYNPDSLEDYNTYWHTLKVIGILINMNLFLLNNLFPFYFSAQFIYTTIEQKC